MSSPPRWRCCRLPPPRSLPTGLPVLDGRTLPWIAALVLADGHRRIPRLQRSLQRNGPVLTSASLSLTPVYAAGMAMALIGEPLAWYHAAALALVVAGLLLINRGAEGIAHFIPVKPQIVDAAPESAVAGYRGMPR